MKNKPVIKKVRVLKAPVAILKAPVESAGKSADELGDLYQVKKDEVHQAELEVESVKERIYSALAKFASQVTKCGKSAALVGKNWAVGVTEVDPRLDVTILSMNAAKELPKALYDSISVRVIHPEKFKKAVEEGKITPAQLKMILPSGSTSRRILVEDARKFTARLEEGQRED